MNPRTLFRVATLAIVFWGFLAGLATSNAALAILAFFGWLVWLWMVAHSPEHWDDGPDHLEERERLPW